jgi:hypothetical protein
VKPIKASPDISQPIYQCGIIILLLFATALRLYALSADPPIHLSIYRGLNTDGAQTMLPARSMVLFGSWYPYPNSSYFYYTLPAISWLGYLFFTLFGVGYWQANLIPAFSGLLTIAILAGFARQQLNRRISLLVALFLTTNHLFVVYNRIPVVYSLLLCGMAFTIYCWGRGLRHPTWFFWSGLVMAFTIGFIKITAIALIPTMVIAFSILIYRRTMSINRCDIATNSWRIYIHQPTFKPVLLFGLGILPIAIFYWIHIILPQTILVDWYAEGLEIHTFHPRHGLIENFRLAVVSFLQFGVLEGVFLRMLPLFLLAFGYLSYQTARLLAPRRPHLPLGELVGFAYLVGSLLILFTLAAATRPIRYYLILLPPLCFIAALAIDYFLRQPQLKLPERFSRFYPLLIMGGLTYLWYQLFAAIVLSLNISLQGTGLGDPNVMIKLPVLFTLFALAMLPAIIGTMLFIWRVISIKQPYIPLPGLTTRYRIAGLIIALILCGDLYQYWYWMRDPQFSIVQTSRQVGEDIGPDGVLGGAYAAALALDNKLPVFIFFSFEDPAVISQFHFTHLALDADNTWHTDIFNDDRMYQQFPELMQRAKVVKVYTMWGYQVKLYKVE